MIFGGIQRTSTLDFPGTLSCVVFTKGCDLDCFYCHNRRLIAGGESEVSEGEVWAFLEKRRGLLDGVVISGGEPTLQRELGEFIRRTREMGYRIKLDTNGQRPEAVERLARQGLLDYVAVDIKAMDYRAVCGAGEYAKAIETIEKLKEAGVPFEARTTLYPGMGIDDLRALLKRTPKVPLWRLNYFRPPEGAPKEHAARLALPALTRGEIQDAAPALEKIQPHLTWK